MIDWKNVPSGALLQIAKSAPERCPDAPEAVAEFLKVHAGEYHKLMSISDDYISLSGQYGVKIPYAAFDCALYSGVQVIFDEDAEPEFRGKLATIERLSYDNKLVTREFPGQNFPPEYFSFPEDYTGERVEVTPEVEESVSHVIASPIIPERNPQSIPEPAKKKVSTSKPGYDAVEFLDLFMKRQANRRDFSRWVWSCNDTGTLIHMHLGIFELHRTNDFTSRSISSLENTRSKFAGIERLKKRLLGRRIESLNYDGKWYLQVIDDGTSTVQPEREVEPTPVKKDPPKEGVIADSFLTEVFSWMEVQKWNFAGAWNWTVSKDGKVVNMRLDLDRKTDRFDDLYIHERHRNEISYTKGSDGKSLFELKALLGNSTIVSCRGKNNWYLKVISPDMTGYEDAESYLNRLFDVIDSSGWGSDSSSWRWSLVEGLWVNMHCSKIRDSFISRKTIVPNVRFRETGRGLSDLKRRLRGYLARGVTITNSPIQDQDFFIQLTKK